MDLLDLRERFPAAPDYLSNMYLIERDYGEVSNRRLAAWMGVSAPAASQAVNRLKALELVEQAPYGTARLAPAGRDLALVVLKRHYLMEHLLVRVLGYPWEKADDEAHVLQNYLSRDLVDHLDAFLGHPDTCPHGNPLPGTAREPMLLGAPRLSDAPLATELEIVRITEEGESVAHMLGVCQALGMQPGTRVRLIERGEQVMRLETRSGQDGWRPVELDNELARHVRYAATNEG